MAGKDREISDALTNNNELVSFTVKDLKAYLANRRLNVSGRKSDLIERINGAKKLDIVDNQECERLDNSDRIASENDRYKLPNGNILPKPSDLDKWESDVGKFPGIIEKDIYNYIVLKKNSKRQLKSRVFYEDGHVQNIEVHLVNDDSSHCFVRASVLPSFPTADKRKSPEYQPWVSLSKVTGCIHSAFCDCPAGEGECCNHIGALLYGLEDLTQKKNLAPTSKPCAWNNYSMLSAPRKRKLTPRKSEDLVYRKRTNVATSRKLTVEKDHELNRINGCTVNIERFKERLISNKQNVGWLKNFIVEDNEPTNFPTLPPVPFNYCNSMDLRSQTCQATFQSYFNSLTMSDDNIQLVEILTRGQKGVLWSASRKERLTASNFGTLCKRREETSPEGILNQIIYSNFTSMYTEYGKNHEKAAKRMYVKKMQTEHRGLKVKDCGLNIHKEKPHLGATPDGIVYCSHCEDSVGLLEIKCPASRNWRMLTPEQCSQDKNFFCLIDNGKIKLKTSHPYYYQVQGQLGVTGKQWCDFVVWTCAGLNVERIFFSPSFWDSMCIKLDKFYQAIFLPELFSRRVERGLKLFKY